MRDEHPDEADRRPRHLAGEDVVRAVALGRLDGRRRRQHHHQAEHHEHGDDDADHVVGGRRRAALDVPHAGPVGVARRSRRRRGGAPRRRPVRRRRAAARAACRRRSATDVRAGRRDVVAVIGRVAHHPAPDESSSRSLHEAAEVVAARRVAAVGVPVEAGAPRRQQHDVAGRASVAGLVDGLGHRRRPSRPAPTPANVVGDDVGGLRRSATTARMRPGSAAIGARSRPLFSPPAMSTTWSKARIATDAACGVVALESLYQRTPPASPTSSMRCGGPTNDASPAATASGPTSPVSSTRAAAARPLVRSWGSARRSAATRRERPGGPTSTAPARPGDVVVGAGQRRTCGGGPGAAREVGHHDRVGGEADGDVVGALLAEDARLGGLVGGHRGVPVEVVRAPG